MIKNFLSDDEPDPVPDEVSPASDHGNSILGLLDPNETASSPGQEANRYEPTEPRSLADSARGMGLAYSAGIAFTAAVVFMLVLGWGADVLLGTTPWGIVGGIILGSVIGFIQFFRITSQIFKK